VGELLKRVERPEGASVAGGGSGSVEGDAALEKREGECTRERARG